MSSYRRFISYMYDCSSGKKRKNCGFLKIEVRKERCVISFQLNDAPCRDKCNVYLYFKDADPQYQFLQSIPVKRGFSRCKIERNSSHITNSNHSISQCSGVLCTDENGGNCCACWDSTGTLPAYESSDNPKIIAKSESIKEVVPEEETSLSSRTHMEAELHMEPDPHSEAEPRMEPEPHPEPKPHMEQKPHPKSAAETPNEEESPSENVRTFPELWDYMRQEFPSIEPFEDNAVVESIKIAPSDLGYLQACNLDLGTNHFLLHGYKCYHHLLIGRLHGQMQYVLGIPGVYDPQEEFMAKMFGFPCFKPIRECRQKNGQFGYWLRCFR